VSVRDVTNAFPDHEKVVVKDVRDGVAVLLMTRHGQTTTLRLRVDRVYMLLEKLRDL
jgi:hypothetical protein